MRKSHANRLVSTVLVGGLLSPSFYPTWTLAMDAARTKAMSQADSKHWRWSEEGDTLATGRGEILQSESYGLTDSFPNLLPVKVAQGEKPEKGGKGARGDKGDKAEPVAPAATVSEPPPTAKPADPTEGDIMIPEGGGAGKKAPRTPGSAMVSFDFTDYDLNDLLKRISEMTGKNFILTEPISGKKVTILSPKMISVDEAYQVFLSVMRSAGYTVVPLGRSLKVVPLAGVASEAIPTHGDEAGRSEEFITRLLKVQNISVEQIAGALQKMISPNGSVITYAPTNTLIFTDNARNIDRIVDIINRLDVESPTEQLVIIPIRYAAAVDIADKLLQVYGDSSTGGGSGPRSSTGKAATPGRSTSSRSKTRKPGGEKAPGEASSASIGDETPLISKVIADDRTNSLIILATEKALEDITALVSKLDVDVDEALKSDIHVVHLKYAKAEELAATLASLVSGAGGQTSRPSTTPSRTTSGSKSKTSSSRTTPSANRSTAPVSGGSAETDTFEGGVRITADPPTNSLVITASYNDYQTLRRVIERLDIRRKQVFVEAVILELTQDNTRNVGLNYHGGIPGAEEGAGALFARGAQSLVTSDPDLLTGLAIGVFGASISAPGALAAGLAAATGTTSTGSVEIPAFGIVLQALQQDKDVNILSTPSILTSNNEEAKIVVGQNVPFQSGSTISNIGSNISINREDVALTLKVTPQVNYSNEVTLNVFQEITEVVASTSDSLLGPTTTKRSAETVVSVPDNQTVVIGGLIQTKENDAEDKIPILGDIPLLGVLFRTKTRIVTKSNMLIFLTPHIVETSEDLQNVYLIKMAQRQEFIRRFYGKTREEQLRELDALVKYSMNLPDIPPLYPDRELSQPMETTIETSVRDRGFIAPIPGADSKGDSHSVIPVLPSRSTDEEDRGSPESDVQHGDGDGL